MDHYQKSLRGAAANRKKALERYYKDPALCIECGSIIEVGPAEPPSKVRKTRKFCSQSCAGSFNGKKRFRSKTEGECERCGSITPYTRRSDRNGIKQGWIKVRFCPDCRIKAGHETLLETHKKNGVLTWDLVGEMTKDELLKAMGGNPYWFKLKVTNHARIMWKHNKRAPGCEICDFEFHAICHKKPVKDFPETAKIKKVNSNENLIGLCPNHHYLLDKGLLDLNEHKRKGIGWVT